MQYIPSSGEMSHLLNSLQKSKVGYQTALTPSADPNAAISPLVPQQLQNTLSVATSSMSDLKLWPMLSKTPARNTVVEYNRVIRHGGDISPFIAEGGTAALNRSQYEKVAVQIRYLAEKREVTDQAAEMMIVGPTPNVIAEETRRGTERLLRRVERELFHGDSSLNDLAWDGIIKQIKDNGNSGDNRGAALTAPHSPEILGHIYSAPIYGMVAHILVTPRVLTELIKQTVVSGRHDQLQVSGSSITYGAQNISITGPYGPVPVVACPFLERNDRIAPAAASSQVFEGTIETPTISAQPNAVVDATAKFTANEAGGAVGYRYRVVPVGDAGVGVPVDTNAEIVAVGEHITFTIAQADAKATVKYYKVYRSAKDATSADGALLIGEFENDGANTIIVDRNFNVPGSSDALFVNMAPDYMEYFQLLSLIRRPLAQINTSYPFLLMMFGAPAVKLPSKMFVLKNCGVNAASGLSSISDPVMLGMHV